MTGLSFADAIQLLLVGLSQGCLYSLIAIGLVLVYKATEQVNFAQKELAEHIEEHFKDILNKDSEEADADSDDDEDEYSE